MQFRHTIPVLRLHPCEIQRRRWLPFENRSDEKIFIIDECHRRIESPFITDRRLWNRTERLATRAPRAMRGKNLEVVRQFQKFLRGSCKLSGRAFHHALMTRGSFKKIGSTQISDEDEISAQKTKWFVGTSPEIGDDVAEMFRRVTGRVSCAEFDPTHVESVIISQHHVRKIIRPPRGPFVATMSREVQGRTRGFRKCLSSGEEVRVDVRFRHRGDPESVRIRQFEVPIDVSGRVEDDRITRLLTTDQPCRMCEVFVIDLS